MSEHFAEISARYLKRRTLLKLGALSGALLVTPAQGRDRSAPVVDFEALPNGLDEFHEVAAGYDARVLIRWGDDLDGNAPAAFPLKATHQAQRFGFNNDFIAYVPLDGSGRGLLCVNHEYPIGHLMFPGYPTVEASKTSASRQHVESEMAAVGHGVIEIERNAGGWRIVADSPYRRRIDANTAIAVDGPAAGHRRLRTGADPKGSMVKGTLGCCSGGKTPWGTVLIGEENVGDYFSSASGKAADNTLLQTDPAEVHQRWATADPRFNLDREPNELNRFGWIVEFDPREPNRAPVKHTALGRFEHEGATVAHREGTPLVVYSADDSENEFIYRFVSGENYTARRGSGNSRLLTEGTLYCARFNDDGTGRWLPLRHGEGPLTSANGFEDQGDVLIDARRAAALLGATPMDRPEGIAIHPASGGVYVSLTKNRKKRGTNAANPRRENAAGHVLEIVPPVDEGGARHWEERFAWDLLREAGDTVARGDARGAYGGPLPRQAWLANPDNLAFDPQGRLWIATDGMDGFGLADGLWCTAVAGPGRGVPHHFLRCPRGAELCGPEFTPDGETLFVAVQHPAKEDGSSFDSPSTRWPDFDARIPPRPAVLAITRRGGGPVGG